MVELSKQQYAATISSVGLGHVMATFAAQQELRRLYDLNGSYPYTDEELQALKDIRRGLKTLDATYKRDRD